MLGEEIGKKRGKRAKKSDKKVKKVMQKGKIQCHKIHYFNLLHIIVIVFRIVVVQ